MADVPHSGQVLIEAGILPMAPGPYIASHILGLHEDTPLQAANKMGVDIETFEEVLSDQRPIDHDLAVKLADYAGTTRHFWLSLQAGWDYAKETLSPDERTRLWAVAEPRREPFLELVF